MVVLKFKQFIIGLATFFSLNHFMLLNTDYTLFFLTYLFSYLNK